MAKPERHQIERQEMTLIVVGGNAEYVVLAADMRLSWNGQPKDDRSGKLACVTFYDGTLISAYTGLAQWHGYQTREWLLSALYKIALPWKNTGEVMSVLRSEITDEFRSNSDFRTLFPDQRKLSLIFTGFVDGRLVMFLISNFEDHVGLFPTVQDEFVLTRVHATNGTGVWSGILGARSTVDEADKIELNSLLELGRDARSVKGKCHAMITRAGPRSNGYVGPHILTATLSKAGPVSSWYSSEDADETIRTVDQFHSLAGNGGYPMAIRDVRISAPGITSQRPARRGRRGKHEP